MINKPAPRPIVINANEYAKHKMIKRELHSARLVLSNHQEFSSDLCALAARVVASHGRAYNGGA